MAQWYTSNVESSLNNLRLFVSIPSNSNRIVWSFILKKKQEYCFLVCAGLLENLVKLLWWKIGLRRGRKQYQSILNINNSEVKVKIKYVFTFYFMSFWAVQRELQHIEFLHFWYIFCEFPAWKTEVRKLASQYLQFWICLNMS